MNVTTSIEQFDDTVLRKAWLKQRFGSFAYHEELLQLHEQFKRLIKGALARPEVRRDHPESHSYFIRVIMPNIDGIPSPGQLTPEKWEPGRSRGFSGNIRDYSQYIAEDVYWDWMPPTERQELGQTWGRMDQACTNIRRTVDNTWFQKFFGNDDELLDEESTGPVDWPSNWREQVLGAEGAALARKDALRIKAGNPVPEAGAYVALDPRDRRFTVKTGDTLPDLGSTYGITVWQRVAE